MKRFAFIPVLFFLMTGSAILTAPVLPRPLPIWGTASEHPSALLGRSVASAGDVNGDSYDDVIIGMPWFNNDQTREGGALLHYGSQDGLRNNPTWRVEGNTNDGRYGHVVGSAGDVNGDGYDDVFVGKPVNNGSIITTDVYYGSPSGLDTTPDWSVTLYPGTTSDMSVAGGGDVNGDGFDDLVVGVPDNIGSVWSGAVFAYYGSASGLSTSADWMKEGTGWYGLFGDDVALAGDVNNDGYDDLLVSAPQDSIKGRDGYGAVYIYRGSPTGLKSNHLWKATTPPGNGLFGDSVAWAGDINNDGYDDVLVGDYFFGSTGASYLYLGRATKPRAVPDWRFYGQSGSGRLGIDVASAGDVNNDNYADVIVGDFAFNGGEGAAFLFLGGPDGLKANPDWRVRGGQSSSSFGVGVSSAGDINGDDFDEILIGASHFTHTQSDEGAAFLFAPYVDP